MPEKKYDKAGYPWPDSGTSGRANLIGYHNNCSFCGRKASKEIVQSTDTLAREKFWR